MGLWERIPDGDPGDFEPIERQARAVLSGWGHRGEALETLVKEVLAKIWEEAVNGKPEPINFRSYVWNKCRGAAKARARSLRGGELPEGLVDTGGGAGSEAERYRRDLRETLAACCAAIPEEEVRRAWELRYEVEPNRKAGEVAELMSVPGHPVPTGTVMGWWDRARRYLRPCLERKGWVLE